MVAWTLSAGWVSRQTARNEKMRIRSNVNLGALLEAQGGYHAAFDAAFSVNALPLHIIFYQILLQHLGHQHLAHSTKEHVLACAQCPITRCTCMQSRLHA